MKPINLSKKIDGKFKTLVKLEQNKWGNWQVSFSPEFKKELDKGEWLNLSVFEPKEDSQAPIGNEPLSDEISF
jgi:hypothetical protein